MCKKNDMFTYYCILITLNMYPLIITHVLCTQALRSNGYGLNM